MRIPSKWAYGGGSRRCGVGEREFILRAADDPRRLDHSGRGVEILDDEAAGGISQSRQGLQYRMDPVPGHRADDTGAGGRRARLRHAGAVVAGQRRGRRRPQGLHRGAARVREARRVLGLLGGQGRFADQDHCRSQGQDHRHFGDRWRHPGSPEHASEAAPDSTRKRTSSWSRSALRFRRMPCARAASTRST